MKKHKNTQSIERTDGINNEICEALYFLDRLDESVHGDSFKTDDMTKLHIGVPEGDSGDIVRRIKSKTGVVELFPVKYSYRQLCDFQEIVAAQMEEFSIEVIGFNRHENRVRIETTDYSDDNLRAIREAFPQTDMYTITPIGNPENHQLIKRQTIAIASGVPDVGEREILDGGMMWMKDGSNVNDCTITCGVINTNNNRLGVLTCAHGKKANAVSYYIPPFRKGGNPYLTRAQVNQYDTSDGFKIGKYHTSYYKNGGDYDFAVYEPDPASNLHMAGVSLNGISVPLFGGLPRTGDTVHSCGIRETSLTGEIIDHNVTRGTYKRQVIVNTYADKGQSGCPLFWNDGNGTAPTHLCGIGSHGGVQGDHRSWFSMIHYLREGFDEINMYRW